jgi:RNA polymerase sigma-70 factor (ECF subfamily)
MIRCYFLRRSGDPEEISDLTQEAIAMLLDAYQRFRGTSKFSTWVYSVCRNVFRKHIYYQARNRKLDRMMMQNYAAACVQKAEPNIHSQIRVEIEALETADRRLYRLFYVEHRSISEIASLLGRTEGTIKWLLFRLRRRIRNAILDVSM